MADQDAASDPSVDANPTPAVGETPEGSTVGPQPTAPGNVSTDGTPEVIETGPKAGPNSEGKVEDPADGVQSSEDLR